MSVVLNRLRLINFHQYKEIAFLTGVFSSSILLAFSFMSKSKTKKFTPYEERKIRKALRIKWRDFLQNRIQNPALDFFNQNVMYLLLLQNRLNTEHYYIYKSNEEKKYQQLTNFVKDLRTKKNELNKEENVFMNFLSEYASVAQSKLKMQAELRGKMKDNMGDRTAVSSL